jgi:hypothetical protein
MLGSKRAAEEPRLPACHHNYALFGAAGEQSLGSSSHWPGVATNQTSKIATDTTTTTTTNPDPAHPGIRRPGRTSPIPNPKPPSQSTAASRGLGKVTRSRGEGRVLLVNLLSIYLNIACISSCSKGAKRRGICSLYCVVHRVSFTPPSHTQPRSSRSLCPSSPASLAYLALSRASSYTHPLSPARSLLSPAFTSFSLHNALYSLPSTLHLPALQSCRLVPARITAQNELPRARSSSVSL